MNKVHSQKISDQSDQSSEKFEGGVDPIITKREDLEDNISISASPKKT